MKILIEKGASVKALDDDKRIPLHLAAYNNSNAEVVKILIEKGASVNALDDFNIRTPLHRAAYE